MKKGLGLTAAGLVIGLLAAALAARWLGAILFDVRPTDPTALGAVAVVLATVAFVASYLPARRALRIEPSVALRTE